jgi:DNA mismatch repair protein MutS
MVEMQETSAILNEATAKSFVVLDEIGRGTSTYDGLAIAFAVTEYLVKKINCLTLFATHYKELIDLTYNFHEIGYLSVTVEEHNNDLVFLHKVKQGVADKSYGVQVAKLAGMPKQVIKTATRIMKELDSISTSSASMPLFQMHDNEPEIEIQQMTPYPDPIIDSLKQSIAEIDLNQLTPLQALNFVHSLKEKI